MKEIFEGVVHAVIGRKVDILFIDGLMEGRIGGSVEVGMVFVGGSGMLTFDEEEGNFGAFGCLFELVQGIHKLSKLLLPLSFNFI